MMHPNLFRSIVISLIALGQSTTWSQSTLVEDVTKYEPVDQDLYDTILAMDKTYFDAYNTCNMDLQAKIYSEDLEFYHDQGGLTTSKKEVLDAIQKNICGKVTRTLVEDSVEVYPIPDYGAVEIGYHKFYNNQEPNASSKPSRFIILWRKVDDKLRISKVISLH